MSDRRTRLIDAVSVLRQSWGDGLVTGTKRRRYPGMSVRPKPFRPGGPPIWIGAVVEPAVRRAGRIADGYMSGDTGPAEFAEQVGWAREGLAEAAVQRPFELSLYQPTFAWENEDAWPLVRDHHHYLNWKYEDMEDARGRSGDAPQPPPLTPESEAEIRRHALVGTPEQVAEGIRGYREVAGDDLHFVAQLYWPGMPYQRQREAMRVFAERVAPLLRD
jgi:alkanesulfonate monooxygenase SsuD/methylene tetrahydromethanopterin reductase-like flavin-dependent oxidoreductase (luciferase family)